MLLNGLRKLFYRSIKQKLRFDFFKMLYDSFVHSSINIFIYFRPQSSREWMIAESKEKIVQSINTNEAKIISYSLMN